MVDNASTDATRDLLKRFEHRARGHLQPKNVGFAAGMNQALEEAGGAWLLSLNPDVLLSPDFISKLVAAGDANPYIGTVCGKLLRWKPGQEPERTQVIDSTGIYFL